MNSSIIWALFFGALLWFFFLARYAKPYAKLRTGFKGTVVIVAVIIIFSFSYAVYYHASFTGALFISAVGIQAIAHEYNINKLKLRIKELEDKLKHRN